MTTSSAPTVEQLAAAAQERGGLDGRRADGAFFTDSDVAAHLVRRAIAARLLDELDVPDASIDEQLACNADLVAEVMRRADASRDERCRLAAAIESLSVVDPTCGAGSFLVESWHVLLQLAAHLGAAVSTRQLHGVDRSADAIEACRATFAIVAPDQPLPQLQHVDALDPGAVPAADVLVGNPPFVRASADERAADLHTAAVPNVSAWVVERALDAARPGARVAFVLPISTSCTDAFAPARSRWERACDLVLTSHYDTIPSSLFRGVVQRLSIYEGRRRPAPHAATPARWYTSRYHRWTRDERDTLLQQVRHVPLPEQHVAGSIAKIGTEVEARLLDRIFRHPPAGRFHAATGDGSNVIRYKRRWSYYLLFCDFVPGIWDADGTPREPSELKTIEIDPVLESRVLLAVYSSTLFWWYFSVFTDNRNVNRRDLEAFPLPDLSSTIHSELADLGAELMEALHACAQVRTCTYRSVGTIRNTYFRQAATRPVLDRIDRVLARAYAMQDDELEFVLGFERRYRS